ncbi:ADP-heptose--LPS heptosyltransferase [Actinobacillus pleuropneumoniae]|nr:ADP-heptose--LPS heptosyltransferase [Actinobacillus pleuropneumoniae]
MTACYFREKDLMNILIIGPSWVGDMMMSHALYQQLKIHIRIVTLT